VVSLRVVELGPVAGALEWRPRPVIEARVSLGPEGSVKPSELVRALEIGPARSRASAW
jgi:hypothetical protein